jgi:hypothetical protein
MVAPELSRLRTRRLPRLGSVSAAANSRSGKFQDARPCMAIAQAPGSHRASEFVTRASRG